MSESHVLVSSAHLNVQVAELGAELSSIIEKASGTELLWQGDTAFWGRTAPILFPIVGRLEDDRYDHGGRSFRLPQHGFARDLTFTTVESGDERVVLELRASDETRDVYPFEFLLRVTHRVRDNRVETTHDVINEGEGELLFSIGAHPAFNVPLGGRGRLDDQFVELELEEDGECRRPTSEGLQSAPIASPLRKRRILDLHGGVFDDGAYIFEGVRSSKAHLRSRVDPRSVTIDLGGAPYLGIWAKPGAPFVCIEPWFGVADSPDGVHDLTKKEGIISLCAGESFASNVSIEIV